MRLASAARSLAAIVGDDHVRETRLPPGENASGDTTGGPSALLLRPGSVEQVGEVVALARRDRLRVLPRGSGSRWLPFAVRDVDVVVQLDRLDRIVEHTPEDLVASIECGIAFREARRRLAAAGQRIPLDPPTSPRGTLGGVLATDHFGARRLRHGTARDWVIGTTLVRFDGEVVRAGGMVVKNVSGYDLSKLYIGSWGSLGILVRANFKLSPLPAAQRVLCCAVADPAAAARIATRALEERLPLDSAVLVRGWQPLAHAKGVLTGRGPANAGPADRGLVLGLEGVPETIERQTEALARIAESAGAVVERLLDGEEAEAARDALAAPPAGEGLLLRLGYPPAAYEKLIVEAGARIDEGAFEITLLGSGISWLGWPVDAPGPRPAGRVAELRAIATALGGWLTVERLPRDSAAIDVWGIAAGPRAVMQRLKKALDPDGTFVDGALHGGETDG